MLKFKSGSRRIVILTKRYAIKFPKPTSWIAFIFGIMENLHERYWWCADSTVYISHDWYAQKPHLAKIRWADRFGFCMIMDKAATCWEDDQDESNPEYLAAANEIMDYYINRNIKLDFLNDIKPSNVGLLENGTPVLIDYGYCGVSTYLGNKVLVKK